MTQDLKLMEKHYKTTIINILEDLKKKITISEQRLKLSIELETVFKKKKNKKETLELKNIHLTWKIHWIGLIQN